MKKEEIEISLVDAAPKYARDLLQFYRDVGGETPYLAFDEAGLSLNQNQEEQYLKRIDGSWTDRMSLALLNDEIIGVASVSSDHSLRSGHLGEFGIVIRQRFWGFGLSKVLMKDMLEWAEDSPELRYLKIEVDCENIRAIKLYQHFDFEELGRIPGGSRVKETYHDTLLMGRFVLNAAQGRGPEKTRFELEK